MQATIQAIGRCAASIKEVANTCLNGLVHLLSNKDEYVVAESVVVIKKLLQSQETEHKRIISQMSKLLDFIMVPGARASILWLIGEYNDHIPKIAPDVLRKLAKTFCEEQNIVKMQILNLAVKLYLTNQKQTELLVQYVFNMARYDANYDVRDRARFLKLFIFPQNENSSVAQNAKNIFLTSKPAPQLANLSYLGRESYQLGSMSHFLNQKVAGYKSLPGFPEVAPDSKVRNVETAPTQVETQLEKRETVKSSKSRKPRSFYSSSDNATDEEEPSSSSEESSSDESSSAAESESESDSNNSQNNVKPTVNSNELNSKALIEQSMQNNVVSEDSESDSSVSADESSEENSDEKSDQETENPQNNGEEEKTAVKKEAPPKNNLDLLLDLDEIPPMGPIMTPSLGGFLTPLVSEKPTFQSNRIELVGPSYISSNYLELLNRVNGYGLGILYKFTRAPHLFSSSMISIELQFTNHSNVELTEIQVGQKNLPNGMSMNDFPPIASLNSKAMIPCMLGIDFNDSSQSVSFEIKSNAGISTVNIKPPIGELVRSITMSETMFKEERANLKGMTESQNTVTLRSDLQDRRAFQKRVFEVVNVASINHNDSPDLLFFAGQTMNSKSLVLITVLFKEENTKVVLTVNCEKMVLGSIMMNEIKDSIKKLT